MRPLSWREKQSKLATQTECLAPEAVSSAFPKKTKINKIKEKKKKTKRFAMLKLPFFVGSGKTAAYFLFECGEDGEDNKEPTFFSVRFHILRIIFVPPR